MGHVFRVEALLALVLLGVAVPPGAHGQERESALPAAFVSAVAGDPALGLTLNQTTFRPGDSLSVTVSVVNPGGGPLCDFFVLIRLPDGAVHGRDPGAPRPRAEPPRLFSRMDQVTE